MARRRSLKNSFKKRNRLGKSENRRLHHETLEQRQLLAASLGCDANAPRLLSVSANSGELFQLQQNNVLPVAPTELTLRFDGGQEIDPDTLSAIQFIGAGGDGSFDDGNEQVIEPGFVGFDADGNTRVVVARFSETLPDDDYRIRIAGFDDSNAGIVGLKNIDGDLFCPNAIEDPDRPDQIVRFEVEVGAQVVAVVPQPIGVDAGGVRVQRRDQIHVFFNEDPLSDPAAGVIDSSNSNLTVVRPDFYKLFFTDDTVENTDDGVFTPTSIEYDPQLHRAVLSFGGDIADLAPDQHGTFRLRIGASESLPAAPTVTSTDLTGDVQGTFAGAEDLGVSFGGGAESIVVRGEVQPNRNSTVRWPGVDAPGTRDDRRDPQLTGQSDTTDGINVYYYNFAEVYGLDPFDNVLENVITDAQKQRTREILDLYAEHLGVKFIETEDRGLQIVTGDLRALVETARTGPGGPTQAFRLNDSDPTRGVLVMDGGENWYDGYGLSPDARPSWFAEALRGVGSLLGIGHTFDQVPGVASGSNPELYNEGLFPLPDGSLPTDFSIEPDFLSSSDIIPGQALHRPETSDEDIYRFDVGSEGLVSIETFAERLDETSLLDTDLKLWKFDPINQEYNLVARNNDFFSNDSFVEIEVAPNADGSPGRYIIGITAKGNDDYNPRIADSGSGGRSEGRYEIRVTFQEKNLETIVDTAGTSLDGDGDGIGGGDFNFWFRTAKPVGQAVANAPRTLFVHKAGVNSVVAGSLSVPFQTIDYAFSQARPGDIVRILPSAGADGKVNTVGDNRAYEIGRGGPNNAILSDGETLNVPQGVTVMVDAGVLFKMRNAKISVGSERIDEDRSLAALQVLGTPILVEPDGTVVCNADGTADRTRGKVVFTSYQDESIGIDTNPLQTAPAAAQWAGIEFRNDFDFSEGRPVWETEGVFIDYVSHADIRYGGGNTAPNRPVVNPLQMLEARPTLIYNTIRFSGDAAMSADPNSFEETNFHAPIYQRADAFTSDYQRVGPDIRGNTLIDNSINGLFVRVRTPAIGQRAPMTVSGRFDDRDITHVISEVLVLEGQPGGPLLLEDRPDVLNVTINAPVAPAGQGSLAIGETYDYRVTFITARGRESLASLATAQATVSAAGSLQLTGLPEAPSDFAGRRLYRLDPSTGDYVFVEQLDRNSTQFLDVGETRGGLLSEAALAASSAERLFPRFDARLSIDPGMVLKLDTARIESRFGADFYAEGRDGQPVIFTSRLDDSYGAGGTFDTNNDGDAGQPSPGNWGGLVIRQGSTGSLDHVIVSYAGGNSSVSGGFAEFNAVEVLQSDVRIANSLFTSNASGNTGTLDTRDGIGFNSGATIFIRGAQPIIVDNVIRNNGGAALSVNPDALNYQSVQDPGRGIGPADRFVESRDNQGPLITGNQLDDNEVNGLLVRNEALTTESVWDDTDIVHVVERFVYAWNHHHRSGLRLKSDSDQSLVVKMQDGGALVADRYLNDVEDAIGGTIQVIGQPGFPVVLTSIHDDSVGAGFTASGLPQTDTDNLNVSPTPGDWHGIVIRAGANDRNVPYVLETEAAIPAAAGQNLLPSTAQVIGSLATGEFKADENRRLGFNVRGTLSQNSDVDVYTFTANGQTEVYLDIDDTHFGLDTVVELIDVNGNILALSDSSFAESTEPARLVNNLGAGRVLPLFKTGERVNEGPNALDGGMRVILPGNSNTENQYFVRIRSSNRGPNDPASKLEDNGAIRQGRSRGQYQLSIRLRETDEIAGTTVRLADIRYATDAIDVPASPFDSPLVAEAVERLDAGNLDLDQNTSFTNGGAHNLGNVNESHRRVLRVSGTLGNNTTNFEAVAAGQDLDVFQVELSEDFQDTDIIGENRFVSAVFDVDYADQLGRGNTRLSIFDSSGRMILHGLDSNVADDQGRPKMGDDMANLTGGSVGKLDSYIGPVELQVGTYYVVVTSAQMTSEALSQYFEPVPTDTNVRMLPIHSVRRIAEEGFDDSSLGVNQFFQFGTTQQLNTTADLPEIVPLFDETSIVPYTLEDVRMFVTLDGGISGTNQTTVVSVDPFTGQLERTIGQFGQPVGDLGMRRDGELFAFSLGPQTGARNAGNTGNYLNVSPIDGSSNNAGDDGLSFQRNNQNGDNTENDPNAVFEVNAMAFVPQGSTSGASVGNVPNIGNGERLIVVGDRSNGGRGGEVIPELRQNVVYSMVATDGSATNRGSTNGNLDRSFNGNVPYVESYVSASNKVEYGVVDVGQFPDSDPDKTGGTITGLAQNQNVAGILGSTLFGVTDEGALYSFDTFDTRTVDVSPIAGGSTFSVINSTFYGSVERDPQHQGFGNPEFSSLTLGPRATEGGRFETVFFATTTDGWMYTFQIDASGMVEPAPVLVNGRSAVPILSAFGNSVLGGRQVTGVSFSIREENPWHQTNDRNTPFSVDQENTGNNLHGVFIPDDQSRERISGGSSLYFGFEPTGNVADNKINDDTGTGNLAPGGAHGTTVSRPFSLEGVSPADKPTVYFDYFLDVQDDADYTLTRQQLDSFRVFAAGDDGQWQLISTSNSFKSFVNFDEYDNFASTGIPVQELHPDLNARDLKVWRQARVDLSPLAGNKNVQLRFDFSSSGGMQNQFRTSGFLTEIQAVPGTELVDRTTFTLRDTGIIPSDNSFGSTTFEFIRGASLNIVHGTFIPDGQQVSLTRGDGTTLTLTLTLDPPSDPSEVQFDRTQTGDEIAANLLAALQALDPTLSIDVDQSQLNAPEANGFQLKPERFDPETLPSFNMPAGAIIPDDQFVGFFPAVGGSTFVRLTLGPSTGPSVVQFQPGETGADIAPRVVAALNALNPSIEAFVDGETVRAFADGQFSLFPAGFSSDSITTINMPDGSVIPDGQQIVVERPNSLPLTVTLTLNPPADATEVQYATTDPGADIATAVANALDALNTADPDFSFGVSANGVELSLSGGSTFRFDSSVFGLESPAVLTVPPGNAISNGQEITLEPFGGSPITLTLVQGPANSNQVSYTPSQSAATIANSIAARLANLAPGLTINVNGSDIVVEEGGEWMENPDRFGAQLSGFEPLANGNIPVYYNRSMSSVEVRDSIRQSLAASLGDRDPDSGVSKAASESFPGYATNRIRVYEHSLAGNTSAVGFSTFLPGDEFGSFGSTNISTSATTGNLSRHGALSNVIEGVYIDDIVVGFASRGEIVYNAPVNRNFQIDPSYREVHTADSQQPEFPNEILVGGYTLEARVGAEYGVPQDYDPLRLHLNEQFGHGRSFDINDRLSSEAVTLIAPAGRDLIDGDTFVLSNGSQRLTFEFDSDGSVVTGNVQIPFVPVIPGASFNRLTDEPAEVARAIRDAINSPQSRNVLGITAAGGDSTQVGPMTGNRIELFGTGKETDVQVNPSSGRFLTLDLVAAETPYGRETARTLPLADQDAETVTPGIFLNSFARAAVSDYTNGQTDTLVATGKIGDRVGTGDANELLPNVPSTDVDIVKIFLRAGDAIDIDLDTVGWNRGNPFSTPYLEVYRDAAIPSLLANSSATAATVPGESNPGASISGFTAPEDDYYFVVVRSDLAGSSPFTTPEAFGEYQLTVRPAGHVSRDVLMVDYHSSGGDTNVFRPQGQLIIESNFIRDYAGVGIRATYSGDRIPQPASTSPLEVQPGGAALLRNQNTERLLPGTVISNNVISSNGGTGILFAGQNVAADTAAAPVPFGRIVNNTIVGSGSGTGIDVTDSVSPTVLNNLITDFSVGLNIGPNSTSTQHNFNAFQGNGTPSNRPLSPQSIVVAPGQSVYQDPARGIYIPASGAPVIDSSLSQLNDRATFFDTVKEPVGISRSPILAPAFDAFGIPRVADPTVNTPGGVGQNVFIDRGAIDRADFVQPVAALVTPTDFIAGQGIQNPDGDTDPSASFVRLQSSSGPVEYFEIQLLDPAGTGPDVATITEDSVTLTEDGVLLRPGVDYTFGYNDNNRLIRLTPLAGIWDPGAAYEITLNNRDRLSIVAPESTSIVDGDQFTVSDTSGLEATFEFDTGYVLEVTQSLLLTVPTGQSGGFGDGSRFSITAPNGNTVVFEIATIDRSTGSNVRVRINPGAPISAVRDALLAAIQSQSDVDNLDLAPRPLGNNQIQIGSLAGHSVDPMTTPLTVSGDAAGGATEGAITYRRANGDEFVIDLQQIADTDTPQFDPNMPGIVEFNRRTTPSELAADLARAFANSPLGLSSARPLENGLLSVGGNAGDTLDVSAVGLGILGTPGVTGPLRLSLPNGALSDSYEGQTLTVFDGNKSVTYEFTLDSNTTPGNTLIILQSGQDATTVTSRLANSIAADFATLSPQIQNGTTIILNEPVGSTVNAANSQISLSGVAGGAITISVLPSVDFNRDLVAAQLLAAISASPLNANVFLAGGGTLLLDNAVSVLDQNGDSLSETVVGIKDLAGNELLPNRANEETQFTILMPGVELDYGDAPPAGPPLAYERGADGILNPARHTLGEQRLPRLGQIIDADLANPFPDSDDLTPGLSGTVVGGSFAVSSNSNSSVTISVDGANLSEGDTFTLAYGTESIVFELTTDDTLATADAVAVMYQVGDSAETIASNLAAAISGRLEDNATAIVSATQPDAVVVETDDDDGVLIGAYQMTPGIFVDPNGDFLGFLNPLDSFGSELSVNISGSGLLDAWVDFNQDGDWNDPGEQVFANVAVLPGENRLRIQTPSDAADGETWARFRLSPNGNLSPQGVAIGGEVEDFIVTVASVQLPLPVDDAYEMDETSPDSPAGLVVDTVNGVLENPTTGDTLFALSNATAELETDVRFGTLNLAADGSFTYTPNDHFYGTDTFTYRIRGEQRVDIQDPNSPNLPVRSSEVGTVTLTVNPVNDVPLVVDSSFTTLEDIDGGLRITAAELLAGAAAGDFDPSVRPPFDESDQTLRITGINENPNDLNQLVNPPALRPDGEVEFTTAQGMLVRANFVGGALQDLLYFPTDDYNSDNPKAVSDLFDSFTITVYDDGVTVFDDLAGTELDPPLRPAFTIGTVTLNVTPVNDEPIIPVTGPAAVEQEITVLEDSGPYSQPWTPVLEGPDTAADEDQQTVTYAVTPVSGDAARIFAAGPTVDSNGQLDFELAENQNGTVVFEVVPQDDGDDATANGDDAIGEPVLLTITVDPVNDAPRFVTNPSTIDSNGNIQSVVEVLEQDDETSNVAIDWASSVQPAPTSATDELLSQNVTFTVAPQAGNPSGLFASAPIVNPQGVLIFTPAADAVGTAVFVVTASDDGNSDPPLAEDENESTPVTLTIQIRPVNDPPRFDPSVLGTSETLNSDDAWSVAADGGITYRLREDNTQQGTGPQLYRIDLVRQGDPLLYGRIGLLDVFDAGPPNEEDGTLGGSQMLELLSFDLRTTLGGDIFRDVDGNGNPILLYDPPDNVNRNFAGQDSFSYTVTDDGQTWRLGAGLDGDPLTATNTVSFILEPVNDAPQFQLADNAVAASEDAGQLQLEDFATDIFAGPPASALDETDIVSGQAVSFSVTASNPADEALAAQLFSDGPRISPDGTLRFTPAADQYGTIVFDVVLTDAGPDNDIRGDVVSSATQQLTITVRPQNDAPRFANNNPVAFSLDEDNAFLIPLRALPGEPQGLLDKFTVGPANEAADITPGGNQTLALAEPVPASTPAGGQLTRVTVGGREFLRYVPKTDFNGVDSFVYSVRDVNGVSVDADGDVVADSKAAFFTVDLNIRALNDAPQFAGAANVNVLEDAGEDDPNVDPSEVGLTVVPNWATNIQAGPVGAMDETAAPPAGQLVEFTVVPDDPTAAASLFNTVNGELQVSVSSDGTLQFQTRHDANGAVGFTVFATDNGNANPARPGEANTSATRSFTITVAAVNDAPTYTSGGAVTVNEDSGSYSRPWATNILPGPPDEQVDQTVRFEVDVDPADLPLFQSAPQITETGTLRFTPALNAHGTVQVGVRAIDSEGAVADTQTLTITIVPQPDTPVAASDTFTGNEDTISLFNKADVLVNDSDPDLPDDQLTIVLPSNTTLSGATVTLDANNNIVYDPTAASALQALAPQDAPLTDTFVYRLVDSTGRESETATISMVVTGVNDVPEAVADNPDVQPGTPTILRPLDNDIDVDGTIDPSTLEITLQPAFGSVSVLADGTLRYTPFSGFRGNDLLRYTVADDLGGVSQEGTITISSNQAPVAGNDSATGFRDQPFEIAVLSNDNDPDGSLDPTSIVITRAPTRGQVVPLSNGRVRYVPNNGFFGSDSFAYTVSDNQGRASNVGQVSLQIAASQLQNPNDRADVNDDGEVSPIDALLIINYLNSGRPTDVSPDARGPNFYDVDGNKRIEPIDALGVINALNRRARPGQLVSGEGEGAPALPSTATTTLSDDRADEGAGLFAASVDKLVGSGEVRIQNPSSHDEVFDLIARGQSQADAEERTETVDDLWSRFDRVE